MPRASRSTSGTIRPIAIETAGSGSCSRNEGTHRSSDLVRQADAIADAIWPGRRHYTYVNPQGVRSTNPGCCFRKAGWRRCGRTKGGLLILERISLCPSVPTLSTYIGGGLARIERAIVENHLQTCGPCRDIAEVIEWSLGEVEDEATA